MDLLSDTTSWSLLLGVVTPYLVAVVNRPEWSTQVRRCVAIGASVVGGVLVCLSQGVLLDAPTVMGSIVLVLVASQTVYAHLIRETVKKVEVATSPRRSAVRERETFEGYDDTPGQHSEDRGSV